MRKPSWLEGGERALDSCLPAGWRNGMVVTVVFNELAGDDWY